MKTAYSIWTWLKDCPGTQYMNRLEQTLKEIAYLGYDCVECTFDPLVVQAAGSVATLLGEYGVGLGAVYLNLSGDQATDTRRALECAAFMERVGCELLNVQGPMLEGAPPENGTAAVLCLARIAQQIGAALSERGMRLCFHPHWDTAVFEAEQVDCLLEHTARNAVYLCPDTGHMRLAGMDLSACLSRWVDRVGYVHFKDIDSCAARYDWPIARFLPLGWGEIDFRAVYDLLKRNGYDGLCDVELDVQPVCDFHSAMTSRRYLREALGL